MMRSIPWVATLVLLQLQCSPPKRVYDDVPHDGQGGMGNNPQGEGGSGVGDGGDRGDGGLCTPGDPGCTSDGECARGYYGADCAVRFQGLGFPRATDTFARATGVSGDGTTVIGSANQSTPVAFRWQDGTFELLGTLPGGLGSDAVAINGDGSVIVGDAQVQDDDKIVYVAVQWDGDELTSLGFLEFGTFSHATGISGDGTHVVGYGDNDGESRGLHWDSGAIGTVHAIDPIRPTCVSDNGDIVGGYLAVGGPTGIPILYSSSVVTELDIPLNFDAGQALDITPSGANATGFVTNSGGQRRAILWTGTSALALGTLDGSSEARGINADGSVVVGTSGGEAWVWEMNEGMRSLAEVLSELGADLSGWTLTEANGISADGKVIVGTGQRGARTEAWLAELP